MKKSILMTLAMLTIGISAKAQIPPSISQQNSSNENFIPSFPVRIHDYTDKVGQFALKIKLECNTYDTSIFGSLVSGHLIKERVVCGEAEKIVRLNGADVVSVPSFSQLLSASRSHYRMSIVLAKVLSDGSIIDFEDSRGFDGNRLRILGRIAIDINKLNQGVEFSLYNTPEFKVTNVSRYRHFSWTVLSNEDVTKTNGLIEFFDKSSNSYKPVNLKDTSATSYDSVRLTDEIGSVGAADAEAAYGYNGGNPKPTQFNRTYTMVLGNYGANPKVILSVQNMYDWKQAYENPELEKYKYVIKNKIISYKNFDSVLKEISAP